MPARATVRRLEAWLVMFFVGACAHGQTVVRPAGGPWDSGEGFRFGNHQHATRQSVSGIACNLDAKRQRTCLVVFDEGVQSRYASIRNGTLVAHQDPVALLRDSGELDAEGAATDGKYFYVTGSHSAKRSDCVSNPASRHVIRFRVDPATGRALAAPAGSGGMPAGYQVSERLWSIMLGLPQLQAHVGERKCLGSEAPPGAKGLAGQQGVNIEGLAIRNERLYFGFRGPAEQGVGNILSVDTEALFQGGDPKAMVTPIALGARRGIRDMVAVKDGLLLLAGPDDSAGSAGAGWNISWWDGRPSQTTVNPKVLAALDLTQVKLRPCDKTLKPEAITVLEETATEYRVLVLSDGMCDGGPLAFSVAR